MNAADIVIAVILAAAVLAAVVVIVVRRRKGKGCSSCCGGQCAFCGKTQCSGREPTEEKRRSAARDRD